jgi:ribosome-binding protein aMBF1 (putative translation factor)
VTQSPVKYDVAILRPGRELLTVIAKKSHIPVKRPSKRPSPLQRAFADNLMVARKQAGLSQRDLARLIGGSQNQISEIENCTRNVTFRTVTRLARALKVSEFDLLSPPE